MLTDCPHCHRPVRFEGAAEIAFDELAAKMKGPGLHHLDLPLRRRRMKKRSECCDGNQQDDDRDHERGPAELDLLCMFGRRIGALRGGHRGHDATARGRNTRK